MIGSGPGAKPLFRYFGAEALLIMGVMTAIVSFAAWLVNPVVIPASFDLTITATGAKNPASGGKEVWTMLAPSTTARFDTGWEMRDGSILVSYQNQPAIVVLTVHRSATQPVKIARNKTSGIITIEAGGRTTRHDLYSEVSDALPLDIKKLATPVEERGARIVPWIAFFALSGLLGLSLARKPGLLDASTKADAKATANFKASLLVVATWTLFSQFMATNIEQAEAAGFTIAMVWILVILALQLTLVSAVYRFAPYDLVAHRGHKVSAYDLALASCFAANVTVLNFSPQALWKLIVTVVVAGAGFLVAEKTVEHVQLRRAVAIGVLCLVAMNAVAIVGRPTVFEIASVQPIRSASSSERHYPNIYFISFDALGSFASLQGVLDPSGKRLFEVLEASGFFVAASQSPAASTAETFYQIFTARKGFRDFDFLKGLESNPTLDRLRHNGYKVQSIQTSAYFGLHGSTWDYAWPDSRPPLDFCWNALWPKFMYGLCGIKLPLGMAHFDPIGQIDVLTRRTPDIGKSANPWFTFAHVLWPGHTWGDFDGSKEQRTIFIDTYNFRLNALAAGFAKFVSALASNDPNAIVIVHGDHGPLLSKPVARAEESGYWSLARIIRDRQEVVLAVRPKDVCNGRIQVSKSTAEVLPELFNCLDMVSP